VTQISLKLNISKTVRKLSVEPTPLPPPTYHSFRRVHSIDINSFRADLQSSDLITNPPQLLDSLLPSYNSTLSSFLDKHAPIITKLSRRKSKSNPWFTATLLAFRSSVRHTENILKRTHSACDWSSFKSLRNRYHSLIVTAKKQYYSKLVTSSSDNPRHLANCQQALASQIFITITILYLRQVAR